MFFLLRVSTSKRFNVHLGTIVLKDYAKNPLCGDERLRQSSSTKTENFQTQVVPCFQHRIGAAMFSGYQTQGRIAVISRCFTLTIIYTYSLEVHHSESCHHSPSLESLGKWRMS